jgi:hypothetical protein
MCGEDFAGGVADKHFGLQRGSSGESESRVRVAQSQHGSTRGPILHAAKSSRGKCGARVMSEHLHDSGKPAGLFEEQVCGIKKTRAFGHIVKSNFLEGLGQMQNAAVLFWNA